jgi:hypothetical protein
MRQDLDLLLVAEDPLRNIDDLAKIYDQRSFFACSR